MIFLFLSILNASYIDEPIEIDGRLKEKGWETVRFYGDFTQLTPDEGSKPSEKTKFAFAYSDRALYIAFKCYDSDPKKIVRTKCRRDSWVDADWVSVSIDSYNKTRDAYLFSLSAGGARRDAHETISNYDINWDATWEGAVSLDSSGWYAEYRIPFNILRYEGNRDSLTFGIHLSRIIARKSETVQRPLIPRNIENEFIRYEKLTGIKIRGNIKKFDLLPYFRTMWDKKILNSAGLNFKARIKSNITLDGTINPDFGQVESDPAQLNLSTYETYLSEKRPFFMEGRNLFSSYFNLFYSRRIGQIPPFYPAEEESLIDKSRNATILGATKIIGKSGDNEYGLLAAVTDREFATVDSSGETLKKKILSRKYFSVLRYKKHLGESSIGFMGTATDVLSLESPEYSGLVDWEIFPGDNLSVKGALSGAKSSKNGWAGFTNIEKSFTNGSTFLKYTDIQEDYNINDMGYLRRADLKELETGFSLFTTKSFLFFNSGNIDTDIEMSWNHEGYHLEKSLNLHSHFELTNGMGAFIATRLNFSAYDDRITRGGPPLKKPLRGSLEFYFEGNETKNWYPGIYGYLERSNSVNEKYFSPSLTFKPVDFFNGSISFTYATSRDELEWVTNEYLNSDTNFIFSTLNRKTASFDIRLDYIPENNLSLQLWAESYLTSGDYYGFKKLIDPHKPEFIDYFSGNSKSPLSSGTVEDSLGFNPDFLMKALRIHFVLRWEYSPGSEIYFVTSRDFDIFKTEDSPEINYKDLLSNIRKEGNYIYLFKINYRYRF